MGWNIFGCGHATLHPAVSDRPLVCWSVTFLLKAVFSSLLLPNRPRLDCCVSGLVYYSRGGTIHYFIFMIWKSIMCRKNCTLKMNLGGIHFLPLLCEILKIFSTIEIFQMIFLVYFSSFSPTSSFYLIIKWSNLFFTRKLTLKWPKKAGQYYSWVF